MNFNNKSGFLSLCYHYIRSSHDEKEFPRILGTSVSEFENHILMFKKNFEIISPQNALSFSYGDYTIKKNNIGLLLTFDDGLSDHFLTAKILSKHGIKAVFFIPTCILEDDLPANPVIVHYCIAKFGLANFLISLNNLLQKYVNNFQEFLITFEPGLDDPFKIITQIKNLFRYRLEPEVSRKILVTIFKKMFEDKFSNALEIMHLTKIQISEILKMGHSIGSHTRSHISIGSKKLSNEQFNYEIVEPKKFLEKTFGTNIELMSFPFGGEADCLSLKDIRTIPKYYKMTFTLREILNEKTTSPFELGRYMPTSLDSASSLNKKMYGIVNGIE